MGIIQFEMCVQFHLSFYWGCLLDIAMGWFGFTIVCVKIAVR